MIIINYTSLVMLCLFLSASFVQIYSKHGQHYLFHTTLVYGITFFFYYFKYDAKFPF